MENSNQQQTPAKRYQWPKKYKKHGIALTRGQTGEIIESRDGRKYRRDIDGTLWRVRP